MNAEEEHAKEPEGSDPVGGMLAVAILLVGMFVVLAYGLTYPPRFPQLGTSASLAPVATKVASALTSIAFLLILNAAAWWIGGQAARLIGEPDAGRGSDLNSLARLGHGLLIIPIVVLTMAGLHLLYPWLLGLALLVPALAALPSLLSTFREWRDRQRGSPLATDRPTRWLFIGVAIIVVLGPLLVAFGPALSWDGDVYHLPIPEQYLFHNAISISPFSMFTAFPAAPEMLYLLALALPGEEAAKLIHLEMGVLTFALLFKAARRVSARCAALAILFLASEPLFFREMGWGLTDLFGSFYGLFATVAWLDWLHTRKTAWLIRAALFSGACLAGRYLGGIVMLTLIVLSWVAPGVGGLRERFRATLWLGGLASAVLVPWLIRNAVFTGNPISPILQGAFYEPGREFYSELAIAQMVTWERLIGMGRSLDAYLMLPWNLTLGTTPGSYWNSFGFQIGPMHLIATVSGAVVVAWRRHIDMAMLLLQVWLTVTIWFLVFQEIRFLLAIVGTLSLLGALAFDELLPHARRFAPLLIAVPVMAVIITWTGQLDGLGERYAIALGGRDQTAVMLRDPVRIAARTMRREMPPDARVMLVGESRSFIFRGIDLIPYQAQEGPPTLGFLHRAADVDALHCQMAELGVTHVLLNESVMKHAPAPVEGYGLESFAQDIRKVRTLIMTRGRLIHDRDGVRVVELDEPAGCDAIQD